jgi:hypothetical protein
VVVVVVLVGLGGLIGAEPFLQTQDLLLPCTNIDIKYNCTPDILNVYAKIFLSKFSTNSIAKYTKSSCISRPIRNYVRLIQPTLQRQNTEISKQIFPEKEYRGLSPNFHIHASVSDLYMPTIGLPIMLEEIWRLILGLYKSLTDT